MDLILDIDPENGVPSGIEIINLAEQIKGAKFFFPDVNKELKNVLWSTSYDSDYDVAYIGFVSKKHGVPFKTKLTKGHLFLNRDDLVIRIDVEL